MQFGIQPEDMMEEELMNLMELVKKLVLLNLEINLTLKSLQLF